ncbi:unnamed protein product [Urochloa humidicola]
MLFPGRGVLKFMIFVLGSILVVFYFLWVFQDTSSPEAPKSCLGRCTWVHDSFRGAVDPVSCLSWPKQTNRLALGCYASLRRESPHQICWRSSHSSKKKDSV